MFIVLSFLIFMSQPAVAYDSTKLRCSANSECGRGECWVGQCEPSGFCMAYYNCV